MMDLDQRKVLTIMFTSPDRLFPPMKFMLVYSTVNQDRMFKPIDRLRIHSQIV